MGNVGRPVSGMGGSEIALLRWPEDEPRRRYLAAARLPRLLLVVDGQAPPIPGDELEDWLRFPLDPDDLAMRAATLLTRVRAVALRPFSVRLDENDIVRVDGRWAALAPLEARVLGVLLECSGAVVGRPALTRACWPVRPPADDRALDGVVRRLRRRVAPLGLGVYTVPRSGYLLDHLPASVGEHRLAAG